MNAERMRTYLLSLPHVLETPQFGGLIYWVADKAVGGKMFAMINPEQGLPISYPAGSERYPDLLERDGFIPAPYLARAHWVAVERWDVMRDREWESELHAAHALTLNKLPPKTHKALALGPTELKKLIAEKRRVLAAKNAG